MESILSKPALSCVRPFWYASEKYQVHQQQRSKLTLPLAVTFSRARPACCQQRADKARASTIAETARAGNGTFAEESTASDVPFDKHSPPVISSQPPLPKLDGRGVSVGTPTCNADRGIEVRLIQKTRMDNDGGQASQSQGAIENDRKQFSYSLFRRVKAQYFAIEVVFVQVHSRL
jgi:hypothetical protein